MRHIYLVLTLFLAVNASFVSAQTNFLLIGDTTTKWLQQTTCMDPGFGCLNETQFGFSVAGTTTVNNLQYYTIREESWLNSQPWPLGSVNQSCTENSSTIIPFSFGIREDSGKVYYLNLDTQQEHIIYDFTLQVGDSVPDPTRYFTGLKLEILAMDSVLIDGAYRTRWHIDGPGAMIIDGIGSTFGLINTVGWILECGFNLNCYSEGDSALYPTLGASCVTEIGHLTIEEQSLSQLEIRYTSTAVNVVIDSQVRPFEYFLYDNTGRVVDFGSSGGRVTFNYEDYNPGIYFVQVVRESAVQSQQITIR